jgi:hypothetical protein
VIKLRIIKAGHMAHIKGRRNAKLWWRSLNKTDHLEKRAIYRRRVLKWTRGWRLD